MKKETVRNIILPQKNAVWTKRKKSIIFKGCE